MQPVASSGEVAEPVEERGPAAQLGGRVGERHGALELIERLVESAHALGGRQPVLLDREVLERQACGVAQSGDELRPEQRRL